MSYLNSTDRPKVTVNTLRSMKSKGEKIAMLTCYDYTSALLMDATGVDAILVGDSASNVMMGHATTLPITMDQMIYHASSVVRAVEHAFVVVDMPFGSVNADVLASLHNCIRMMKETGADAVKIEGGAEILPAIRMVLAAGIPVVAHLGLTPQSVHQLGGYGLQAKAEGDAQKLMSDACLLDDAGCCALVLEKIPASLAREVSRRVSMPTIGIGAGREVDGQVLVMQDMLGMNEGFKPKFLRCFAQIGAEMRRAFDKYAMAVKERTFPSDIESY